MAKKSTKESDCGTSDSHTETSGGDVTPATKRNLAFLSGNKCANPECNVSLYTSDMTRSIGEAAHIAGEKPEAARYDQNMTNEERRHINNLIYLCANCHTQIDGDIEGERYSVTLLHEWKKKHEDKVFRLLDEGFDRVAPWIAPPGLPQIRTCRHYRIRFLKTWTFLRYTMSS